MAAVALRARTDATSLLLLALLAGLFDAGPLRPAVGASCPETLPLELSSSVKCSDSPFANRTCLLKDVVVWNGRVWLVHVPGTTGLTLANITYGDGEVTPVFTRWNATDSLSLWMQLHNTEIRCARRAVLWSRYAALNYYHTVAETYANLHHRMCETFGDCTYAPKKLNKTLFVFDDRFFPQEHVGHVDALRCLTTLPTVALQHPSQVAWLVARMTVGMGQHAHGYHFVRYRKPKKQLPTEHVRSYYNRLFTGLGLQGMLQQAWSAQPQKLTIINRTNYRRILNADVLVAGLRTAFPGYEVQEVFLEGRSMKDVAMIYATSKAIIQAHGAAHANQMFLNPRAVFINIGPKQWGSRHAFMAWQWDQLRRIGYEYNFVPYDAQPQELVLDLDRLKKDKSWKILTAADRKLLIEQHVCPKGPVMHHCLLKWLGMELKALNVDSERLVSTLARVLKI